MADSLHPATDSSAATRPWFADEDAICRVWAHLPAEGDAPEWFVTLDEVHEVSGDCLLGPAVYEVWWDESWAVPQFPAYLCETHAARARQVGGVKAIHEWPRRLAS